MKGTQIILDYDDTCFPTSWLTKNNINLKNKHKNNKEMYLKMFEKLDMTLFKLFTNLFKYGDVIIITNAMPAWIDITMDYLPNTQKIIKYIKVISARKKYQDMSKDASFWKERAFKDEANNNIKNIISCGDAVYEYHALIKLYDHIKYKKYLKSIRFLSGSHDIDIIIDQLNVLNNSMSDIVNKKKNLDLVFTL